MYWINLNKVAYWINSNKIVQVHEIISKNTQFYLVLILSMLHYILPINMWYHYDVEFKLYSWKFAQNVGIEMSYAYRRDLQHPLKTQKNEEDTTRVFYQINYIGYHIEFPHIRWVVTKRNVFQYIILILILLHCQLTSFKWQRSMIKHKQHLRGTFPFVTLILYKWIQCENIYSWFGKIQVMFSTFFWLFKGCCKSLRCV